MEQIPELTHQLILEYEPGNPSKASENLKLIQATRQFLTNHFKPRDSDNKSQKPLTYTQLRNILLEVKKNEGNLTRIIPKLAYTEARLDEKNQKKLVEFIRELLEKVINLQKQDVFLEFMDMFVALHRYYSSK